jgi:hypothetical protein
MDQRVHVTSQRHESENICEHVSSEAPHAVDGGNCRRALISKQAELIGLR